MEPYLTVATTTMTTNVTIKLTRKKTETEHKRQWVTKNWIIVDVFSVGDEGKCWRKWKRKENARECVGEDPIALHGSFNRKWTFVDNGTHTIMAILSLKERERGREKCLTRTIPSGWMVKCNQPTDTKRNGVQSIQTEPGAHYKESNSNILVVN